MVRVLDSGSSGPGSGPGWGHCVVLLSKTLYSHGASLHPGAGLEISEKIQSQFCDKVRKIISQNLVGK